MMTKARAFALASAALLLALPSFAESDPASEQGWEPIFDGKSLDGWTPKFSGHELGVNYKNTFRVEDGLLKTVYEDYEKFGGAFGHLYYREALSRYRIRLEYRFVGEQVPGAPAWAWRNSGIKLHCQPPETMGLDQMSPVSVEVQLLGGDGQNERPTANMCSMGTHVVMEGKLITQHCVNSSSETFHGDQWVRVEAEVRGGELIRHYVNDQLVMEYSEPQYDTDDSNALPLLDGANLILESGYISLQAESHPVHFRNIEIKRLEDAE